MKYNVLEHELVPEHYVVDKAEEEEILKKLGTTKENLPKILKSDPIIAMLEKIHGPIEEGRLIKIVRSSPTAGKVVVYRVVVEW